MTPELMRIIIRDIKAERILLIFFNKHFIIGPINAFFARMALSPILLHIARSLPGLRRQLEERCARCTLVEERRAKQPRASISRPECTLTAAAKRAHRGLPSPPVGSGLWPL